MSNASSEQLLEALEYLRKMDTLLLSSPLINSFFLYCAGYKRDIAAWQRGQVPAPEGHPRCALQWYL